MTRRATSWSGKEEQLGPCAMGAFNGLAFNSHQTWAFWHAEAVGMIEGPFRCANGTRATMVSARTLSPRLHGAERMRALIDGALEQLLPALSALRSTAPLALWLGLPERYGEHARPGHLAELRRLDQHARAWCVRHAGGGPVSLVPRGHASFAYALLEACAQLATGRLEAAIVGGVDTYHAPEVIEELSAQQRLFDGKHLDSFIPGEGAAFVLLTRERTARRAQLPLLAHVDAVGTAQEPGAMLLEAPCTGMGLAQAMRAALLKLPAEGQTLEWLLGDLTNENYRTTEFQLALPRAVAPGGLDSGGREFRPIAAEEVRMDFLPLRFGDLGAATLPTAAVIASQAFMREAVEASRCLLVASSVGADRGAVLLSRPQPASQPLAPRT
ncbi:MAG TPA: beta-ketoacyl synthase N-terminal-like domain-containing protein [Myxococcaceae bacterium]|nr:beta-ketoacyl synthase N-terminal-like domain-containing protein [Myxococcaceae bacterium]